MTKLNRDDVYYLNAMYGLVKNGDIPLDEYKKLLGEYSWRAEQEAERLKRKDHKDRLILINQWKESRLKDIYEAELNLQKAKESFARLDEDIERYFDLN